MSTSLRCSFCGHEYEAVYLVTGPGVDICARCVALALNVLAGRVPQLPAQRNMTPEEQAEFDRMSRADAKPFKPARPTRERDQ